MANLSGLKISLSQMLVVPGRPDLNAGYIIEEINAARKRNVDIIIFPEMCTTGYIIGDVLEDNFFVEDVLGLNRRIVQATKEGITAIFGTVVVRGQSRQKVGIVAKDGQIVDKFPSSESTHIRIKDNLKIGVNISATAWNREKPKPPIKYQLPFVYLSNTGAQNNGKNIIVFDGSSAVYNKNGKIIFEVPPYTPGSHDFTFKPNQKPLKAKPQNAAQELYKAMTSSTKSMVPPDRKVLVGLSGGIDSAVVCAHLVDVLGPERVLAINMPMPSLSKKETQDMAQSIAQNLGIAYEVVPIGHLVETICQATGVEPNTLAHENVQARARKEILAARAQKIDGMFVCCSNKVEMALGYGTLYGDMAGFYAPLGDLVKREIRQIADYLNRVRFKRVVIPQGCIKQAPTAELAKKQVDPFDYGNLKHRGYHDEMIRAFTELRKNPEWFIELYLKGRLEEELKLEPGTLAKLFPTARDFVNDLRCWWGKFQQSFFKRVQSPPIPIFSKRAFGRDLEESLMLPHYTQRYQYIEEYLLSREASQKQKIVIFGGSMNPPGLHHRLVVEKLAKIFDLVLIAPCGIRADKPSTLNATPAQRKAMTLLTFRDLAKVEFDFYDLDRNTFTPIYLQQERYAQRFKEAQLWFAVGRDLVIQGRSGESEIQRNWKKGKDVWQKLNFLVIAQVGQGVDLANLPPSARILELEIILGRSTTIRKRLKRGEKIEDLVTPEVAQYIHKQRLYR